MRGAPHVGFSATMQKISSRTSRLKQLLCFSPYHNQSRSTDQVHGACRLGSNRTRLRSKPKILSKRQRQRVNVIAPMLKKQDQGTIRRQRKGPISQAEREFQNPVFSPVWDAHTQDRINSPSHEVDVP